MTENNPKACDGPSRTRWWFIDANDPHMITSNYADHALRPGVDEVSVDGKNWEPFVWEPGTMLGATVFTQVRYPKSAAPIGGQVDQPKPETFPQYWTTLDTPSSSVAFVKRLDSDTFKAVVKNGNEGPDLHWTSINEKLRTQLTEAEALALLDPPKPVESPDDWVVQDRCEARAGIDERAWQELREIRLPLKFDDCKDMAWQMLRHGEKRGNHTLHLRCRRKDLPPLPEAKKTRTVTLREYVVQYDDGDFAIVWGSETPKTWQGHYATGNTREIELPTTE